MNTAAKVDELITGWKNDGIKGPELAVKIANACLGWTYIFGDRGQYCTSEHRQAVYNKYPQYKNLIDKCQKLKSGKSTCKGCYWYPGGKTRAFDCRGFTYWVFKQIGITINGAGATSQWNDGSNWEQKGTIDTMPKDKVCCVFRKSDSTGKMEHTLLYDGNGNYIHDNGEVRKQPISKYMATHWAIPKGLYGDLPPAPPEPEPGKDEAIVTGKRVALRYGPTTKAGIIMRINTGEIVKKAKDDPDWLRVSYDGKTGYMMKEFLKEG